LRPVWKLPSELVFLLILAELMASAEGERIPPRATGRPQRATRPRKVARPARGSLSGRRPRG
jgi:hypothetical protein